MYFVVVSILFAFVALVSWATLFEYRLMKTTTPAKSVETNAADDDDASSVCTQCSKCSSGRCSSIGIGLTPSAIPAKAHSADLSMIENNNFLSHYQNGWCACPIESNDRQVSLVYPTLLESLCNNRPNSTSINHESRLTHLLASELCQTKSSPICTIISTTKDDCRAITVDTITPVKTDTEDHSRVVQLLLCFSALNNSRRLFNVSLAGGEDSIHCLHGIKFFCMLWIISGHSYSFAMQWLFFSKLFILL